MAYTKLYLTVNKRNLNLLNRWVNSGVERLGRPHSMEFAASNIPLNK